MTEPHPDAESLRSHVFDELRGAFIIEDDDADGFTLIRENRPIRVRISTAQLAEHLLRIEQAAFGVIGVEPKWRSAVALVAVHISEEAALAIPGADIVLVDGEIRRNVVGRPALASGDFGWSAFAPQSASTHRPEKKSPPR